MAISFKQATDDLFSGVSHAEFAETLECSVAAIRQARLADNAHARRPPPKGWEQAVIKLAEARAAHFARLAAKLKAHR